MGQGREAWAARHAHTSRPRADQEAAAYNPHTHKSTPTRWPQADRWSREQVGVGRLCTTDRRWVPRTEAEQARYKAYPSSCVQVPRYLTPKKAPGGRRRAKVGEVGGGLESKARAPCLASAASRDRPMARRIGRQRSGAVRTASRAGSPVCSFVRACVCSFTNTRRRNGLFERLSPPEEFSSRLVRMISKMMVQVSDGGARGQQGWKENQLDETEMTGKWAVLCRVRVGNKVVSGAQDVGGRWAIVAAASSSCVSPRKSM